MKLAAMLAALPALVAGCAHLSWGDGSDAAQSYYYFIKANYQEMAHDDGHAVESMKAAARLAGHSYYLTLETARLLSRAGEDEDALQYAQSAIKLRPGANEARLFAAWVAGASGQWAEAEKQYKAALAIEPKNAEALSYLAALYAETNRPAEAEATFKGLLAVDPGHLSYYYLGSFYARAGRPREAIKAFEEAIKRNPDFTAALTEVALLYEQQNDGRAAERAYRALIKARPEASMPRARLARLLLKDGRKAEAEGLLNEAGGRALDSTQAQLQIGLIYLDQSLYNEAVSEFEAALSADPASEQARYLLATALMEKGETAKARGHLMRIPATSDLYVDARLLLASTTSGEKQLKLEEALSIITSAIKARPDAPRLVAAEAMLLEELGNVPKALEVMAAAAEKFPREAEIQFRLGAILDKAGDKNGCVAAMKKAIELNPNHAEALNYLAYTWAERRENLKEALSLAQKADALKPNNGYIVDTLGWIRFVSGDAEKALPLLRRAAELSQNDPVVLEHLGDALAALGRGRDALLEYLKAREQGGPNGDALNEKIGILRQRH